MSDKIIKVYVDTNVLINYCTGQKKDIEAVRHLSSKRSKRLLFTSSLAIVQTVSKLQSKGRGRQAFSREKTIKKLEEILPKFTILNLTYPDIEDGFKLLKSNDIEDCVHYVISQKMKCDAIVTNNKKDFAKFQDIEVFNTDLDVLKAEIQ